MTLFSEMEGFPGVIPESLLTGVPVVIWEKQQGSGKDYLNASNSKLFSDYDSAHLTLIDAVENYDSFDFHFEDLQSNLREDMSLITLKTYFSKMYEKYGQKFDGELINTDNLVSRLPAHYVNLPWAKDRHAPLGDSGHILNVEKFNTFIMELE